MKETKICLSLCLFFLTTIFLRKVERFFREHPIYSGTVSFDLEGKKAQGCCWEQNSHAILPINWEFPQHFFHLIFPKN